MYFSYSSSEFLNHVRMHFVSGQNSTLPNPTAAPNRSKPVQKPLRAPIDQIHTASSTVHSEPQRAHPLQVQPQTVQQTQVYSHSTHQQLPAPARILKSADVHPSSNAATSKSDSKKFCPPSFSSPPTYDQSINAFQYFPAPGQDSSTGHKRPTPERSNSPQMPESGVDFSYEFFPNYSTPSPPSVPQQNINTILPPSPIQQIPFQAPFQPSFLAPYPFFSPKFSCMLCPANFSTREELIYHINLHNSFPNPAQPRVHSQAQKRPKPQVHSPLCACVQCRPNKKAKKAVEDIDQDTLRKISALEWERKHG